MDACLALRDAIFPNKERILEQEIWKLENDMNELCVKRHALDTEFAEVKKNILFLQDKANKVETRGFTREQMVVVQKKRLARLQTGIRSMDTQMNTYEKIMDNLVRYRLNRVAHASTKNLKTRLMRLGIKPGGAELDAMIDDLDDVAEINEDMEEMSSRVDNALSNVWTTDMAVIDGMVDEIMDLDDEEEEEEEEEGAMELTAEEVRRNSGPVVVNDGESLSQKVGDPEKPVGAYMASVMM